MNEAIDLAWKWHKNQTRKGSINDIALPQVFHPISVLKRVWEWGYGTPPVLSACACHDIKEDTDITWEELREVIGEEATSIVEELTYEGNSPEEKANYIESFMEKSIEALVIKIADRIQNVKDFMLTKPEYAKKYFKKGHPLFVSLHFRREELPMEVETIQHGKEL